MYVGYFGAAAGVMLLVVLSIMVEESLVKVNAVKNAVSGVAKAMAAPCFALFGDVRWAFVAPLAAGFFIGGLIGPKICPKGARGSVPCLRQPVWHGSRGKARHQCIPLMLLMQ
jgi:uncharacterized membrane protein YfcA